jgi:hypothetical protein
MKKIGWNGNEEKLLCLVVLDDRYAKRIVPNAGEAYLRGFIVQNRETKKISARMRFRYEDGRDTWFALDPSPGKPVNEQLEVGEIADRMTLAFLQPLKMMGVRDKAARDAIECHFPPDDGGDPGKTIIWLEMKDLIKVTAVKIEGGA